MVTFAPGTAPGPPAPVARRSPAPGPAGDIEIVIPKMHRAQRRLLEHKKRFNVVVCGRRFGKTKLAVKLLIEGAVSTGLPVAYFAPTYKYVTEVWAEIKERLAGLFAAGLAKKDETLKRIELWNGGVIEFWSLDKDVARGRKYWLVVVDEAAMIFYLQTAWQNAIRPTLADYRGSAWFLSTPAGFNFFKTLYDKGQDPLQRAWFSMRMPTGANPYIDRAEIRDMIEDLPEEVIRQEIYAEFLAGEGSVFRNIRKVAKIPHAFDPDYYRREINETAEIVAGLDWAQKKDFTVLSLWDRPERRMVDLDRFNKISWTYQRDKVKHKLLAWGVSRVLVEVNSIGSVNFEELEKDSDLKAAGVKFEAFDTTGVSKPPLIDNLALGFDKKELEIINDPVLIAELEAFEKSVSQRTGRPSYSAPAGKHDDTVISSALGYRLVTEAPPKKIVARVLNGRR